jgi:hypothetical protein
MVPRDVSPKCLTQEGIDRKEDSKLLTRENLGMGQNELAEREGFEPS